MTKLNLVLIAMTSSFFATCSMSENLQIAEAQAKTVLNHVRRGNGAGEETFRPSNYERECIEEVCSLEEYLESAENYNSGNRFTVKAGLFEHYYRECMTLVNGNGLNNPEAIDLRGACMAAFETKNNKTLVAWPNNANE